MGKNYRNYGTTYRRPRRPFEKERLDTELQLCGEYGLRNKREILRVSRVLAQLRKSARELLTLDEKDTKRIFEGGAILRRCQRLGLLSGESVGLDNVLSLKVLPCFILLLMAAIKYAFALSHMKLCLPAALPLVPRSSFYAMLK